MQSSNLIKEYKVNTTPPVSLHLLPEEIEEIREGSFLVQVQKTMGVIEKLVIQCDCGQTLTIQCNYNYRKD